MIELARHDPKKKTDLDVEVGISINPRLSFIDAIKLRLSGIRSIEIRPEARRRTSKRGSVPLLKRPRRRLAAWAR